jgi:hypothetical protein
VVYPDGITSDTALKIVGILTQIVKESRSRR